MVKVLKPMVEGKSSAGASADLVQQFLSLCEQPQIKALLASSIATKAEALAKSKATTDKPAGMVALPGGVAKKTGKPYPSKVGLRVADGKWQHLLPVEVVRFILADPAGAEAACKQCDAINEA